MGVNQLHALYSIRSTFTLALLVTLARYAHLYLSDIGLFYDEAQYWTWSKTFAFGYYSKPPVIAWLISLTTDICGNETYCVRASAPALHMFTGLAVYRIAEHVYRSNRIAFWSAMTYLLLPAVTVSSFFISTDAPLLFFWGWGLYAFILALDNARDKYWVTAGILVGLAMMSKYTGFAFFISAGFAMLFISVYRESLLSLPFIVMGIVSLLVFSPNLLWNASHQFVSISHTGDNMFSYSTSLYYDKMLEFLGGQFAVFGPFLFAGLMLVLLHCRTSCKRQEDRLLAAFTFPLLAIATLLALVAGAQAHWAAPIYISGTILTVQYLLQHQRILLKLSTVLHLGLLVGFFFLQPIATHLLESRNPLDRITRWNSLATPAATAMHHYKETTLVTDERKAVAALMYNLRTPDGMPYPVIKWNADKHTDDHYDLTTFLESYQGRNLVFISRREDMDAITPYFSQIKQVDNLAPLPEGFHMYYMYNFKGY